MEKEQLKSGVKYIVKVGRNKVAVRLLQSNADGKTYLVKNLKTGKPFFVPNEKAFVDFQSEAEHQKAMEIIAEEGGTSNGSNIPKVSNYAGESKTSKVPNDTNLSKESKVSKSPKIPKRPQIMGYSKCAFVKALGQNGYKYCEAKKILDALGISMPDASVKIQIYFGKNEKTWEKFGKPAELTPQQKSEIESILAQHGVEDER